MSTLAVRNIRHDAATSDAIQLASDGSVGINAPGGMAFRNRIINGDMRIDQRNAGAAVTATSGGVYTVDRWLAIEDTDGTLTVQQSTTAPAGYTNSLLVTVGTADASLGATQYALISQRIEGFNVADLGWGAAGAQSVTLSFQVRSSLTGTFSGSLTNSDFTRSYPFTFTISAANTFETKTVTIAGDTSGTWLKDNGRGINLHFSMGSGSTFNGTAGSWAGANYIGVTGSVNLVGTAGATFYITGVQLEAGSVATPFERRPYGTELALCQRYLPAFVFDNSATSYGFSGQCITSTQAVIPMIFQVQPRIAPTGITVSNLNHFQITASNGSGIALTGLVFNQSSKQAVMVLATVASGLTAGNATLLGGFNTSALLYGNGCEL